MSFAYIGSVYRLENSAWPHLWPSTGSDYVETVRTRASGSTVFGLKSTQKSTKVVKKWWRICSGLNHHARRRIFEKSRKPLKTLTFSALPNVEKSSIPRSDHMFDHLQKNLIILPFRGVAKVVSRIVRDDEIAGSSPVTSTKKTAENKLFWLVFGCFYIYFSQNRLFSVDHMFAWFWGFLLDFSWLFLNPF